LLRLKGHLQNDGAVSLPGSLIDLRIEGHLPVQTNPLREIYPAALKTPTGEGCSIFDLA